MYLKLPLHEQRQLCVELVAAVTAAAVIAAGVTFAVGVVAALDVGVIDQFATEECLHSLVGIALDAAIELDACLCQRHPGAAADAAADQDVHMERLKKACQRAVTGAQGINNLAGQDLAVLGMVDLELCGVTEMLIDFFVFVGNCDDHEISPYVNSFIYYSTEISKSTG